MKTIEEIMGMVDAFASAVEDTVLSDGNCYKENAEMRAYKAIESALRELVERKPLSDEDIKKHIGVERGSSSFMVIEAIVRATEKAHGIGA